jgi:hypothetical protein
MWMVMMAVGERGHIEATGYGGETEGVNWKYEGDIRRTK